MATEQNKTLIAKKAEEGDLKQILITANDGSDKKDLAPVTTQFDYYESILDNTVRIKMTFTDTVDSLEKDGGAVSVMEGLPIVGTENVRVIIEDANEEKVEVTLFVNGVDPLSESTQSNTVNLSLVSKEIFNNEDGGTRVIGRYDGKISDHVKNILTEVLETDKDIDIEQTKNVYNCWGRALKPFAFTNWIQKKGIPDSKDSENTAGFFLWETSDGYHFKSIDTLMAQDPKIKVIYNNVQDEKGKNIPQGYDGQILELEGGGGNNVKGMQEMGTYKSRIVLFDPFNCYYKIIEPTVVEEETVGGGQSKKKEEPAEMKPKTAAKKIPSKIYNDEVNFKFTRTTYMLMDTGTLPTGDTDQQIEKNEEHNLQPQTNLNQSIMRYNQMFAVKRTITIPGDFTLHAGDAVYIDVPEVSDKENQEVNKEIGGLYIIVDLCHHMTAVPPGCYTKLNLVRDSYGRKPEGSE